MGNRQTRQKRIGYGLWKIVCPTYIFNFNRLPNKKQFYDVLKTVRQKGNMTLRKIPEYPTRLLICWVFMSFHSLNTKIHKLCTRLCLFEDHKSFSLLNDDFI